MKINIRQAAPGDSAEIFAVHASNGDNIPWGDHEGCREHLQWMLDRGAAPIVAETAGRVIGEMELWWGRDVVELGTTLDVSILEVHRDYQRRGVGRALTARAVALSQEHGCDGVSVWTDNEAIGFYEKQGFERRLLLREFTMEDLGIDAAPVYEFRSVELAGLNPPDGRDLCVGRLKHPRQLWNDRLAAEIEGRQWRYGDKSYPAILSYRLDLGEGSPPAIAVYRLTHWRQDPHSAELCLWCPHEDETVVRFCISHAHKIAIKSLSLITHGALAQCLADWGAEPRDELDVLFRKNQLL